MPHQLRRIIAINIRNASDGNPSGRISELDPRGGVLAVGDNGVGKTTFLRLICWRRLNSDPPCRSNIDPGRIAEFGISNCG